MLRPNFVTKLVIFACKMSPEMPKRARFIKWSIMLMFKCAEPASSKSSVTLGQRITLPSLKMIRNNYGRKNANGFDRYATAPSGVDNNPNLKSCGAKIRCDLFTSAAQLCWPQTSQMAT